MSFMRRNSATTVNPFCKVCYDAGLPTEEYNSHFVKDQPGPNGRVVCPTLLAQKCLICGVPGHTSSYCPDNSSVSSSVSSSSSSTVQAPRFSMATDDVCRPQSLHSVRLPPIQKQQQQPQQQRHAPRIVYANELPQKTVESTTRHNFPPLPKLSSLRRFENDEPKLKRELSVAAASPVHSPTVAPIKVKYNKKSNPFGALNDDSGNDSGREEEESSPPVIQKQEKPTSSSSSSSSWASIAASKQTQSKQQQPQQQSQQTQRARSRFSIIVPTAISTALPLLPPISFKPKPVSDSASDLEKKKQTKKLWGDTDSEDDEEFMKRGLTTEQQQ